MMGKGFSDVTTRGGEDFFGVSTVREDFFTIIMGGTQPGTHRNGANKMRTSYAQGVKKGSWKAARADNYEDFAVQNISGAAREQRITQSFGSLSWLACLRRSALILRPQASSTHAEKLAFGLSAFSLSTLASISSIRSCGKRMPIREDLLFLFPVAIADSLMIICGGRTPYIKDGRNKMLDVATHQNVRWVHTLSTDKAQEVHKTAKPAGATNTNGPLTTSVIESNEVAMSNRTTPREGRAALGPNKFTWRFLALGATGSTVIHITATAEHEARKQSPAGFVLIFAGRLPAQEVRHA
jgi:hypothetical protein